MCFNSALILHFKHSPDITVLYFIQKPIEYVMILCMSEMASKLVFGLGLTFFLVQLAILDVVQVESSLLVPVTTTTTEKTTTVRPFSSKRILLSMAKRVFKFFGICNRDMRVFIPDVKEREKRIQCSVKCVLKKMKIVNDKDLINEKSMHMFFQSFLPPDFHEVTYIMMEGCVEEFTEKGDAPLFEDYCQSYGEFLRCIQDNIGMIQ